MKVLMICLGNICRSPMAQGIMEHLCDENDLDWSIDSAGTGNWHIGEAPDKRAIQTCLQNGIDISGQRARQIGRQDLESFDLLLTMDNSNFTNVQSLANQYGLDPSIHPILTFAGLDVRQVPDPYFDGKFQHAFDLLWKSCNAILSKQSLQSA